MIVIFVDECHLRWGDAVGYGWCPRHERLSYPMSNYRERSTIYGGLDTVTGTCTVQFYAKANTDATIAFVNTLQHHYPQQRLVLIWDNATYHKSNEFRAYLNTINAGTTEQTRKVHCIHFAPNDPQQNPIETVWMQAKQYIRKKYLKSESFSTIKKIFLEYIQNHRYTGKNMDIYYPKSVNI